MEDTVNNAPDAGNRAVLRVTNEMLVVAQNKKGEDDNRELNHESNRVTNECPVGPWHERYDVVGAIVRNER